MHEEGDGCVSFTFPEGHSMVSLTLSLTPSPTRSRRPLEVCAGIAGEGERKAPHCSWPSGAYTTG